MRAVVVRALLVALLALCAAAAAGCGEADVRELRAQAERELEEARGEFEQIEQQARDLPERARERTRELRERLARRVRETLERLDRAIPAAGPATRPPARGDRPMAAFLTEVIESVDRYWTTTLRASDLPEPRVSYVWVEPGRPVRSGCGNVADDNAAFYCPRDDTIYIAEAFAADILRGVRRDLPGAAAGQGRAVGDFGVAYIVAHEYAHNVQQELGFFTAGRRLAVKPFELQADCFAGAWGNSVYRAGRLNPGDVEEALGTAAAVGDFDNLNPQHHGTPAERRSAWLTGYRSGDASACQAFLPT
ncbi:MAG TPA: neutral zinc metallopeptidase [Solirubrobacteraceae bacterium]|nr:neutral zinc metallopeptidase [Solirubrobacteraceae bacterium]